MKRLLFFFFLLESVNEKNLIGELAHSVRKVSRFSTSVNNMVQYMILYSAFPHPFKSCKFLARQAIHFRRGLFLSSTKMFRAATLANYAYVSKDVISKCCILHPPNYTRILKRPKMKIPFLKKSSRPFYLLEKQEEFCASHFRQYFFFGNKDFFFVKYYAFFI